MLNVCCDAIPTLSVTILVVAEAMLRLDMLPGFNVLQRVGEAVSQGIFTITLCFVTDLARSLASMSFVAMPNSSVPVSTT